MNASMWSRLSQAVRVHWYPPFRFTCENKMPSADWACAKEGMANRQNLKKLMIPLGLRPVIEIYIFIYY
jgi:hypothetical protein